MALTLGLWLMSLIHQLSGKEVVKIYSVILGSIEANYITGMLYYTFDRYTRNSKFPSAGQRFFGSYGKRAFGPKDRDLYIFKLNLYYYLYLSKYTVVKSVY